MANILTSRLKNNLYSLSNTINSKRHIISNEVKDNVRYLPPDIMIDGLSNLLSSQNELMSNLMKLSKLCVKVNNFNGNL